MRLKLIPLLCVLLTLSWSAMAGNQVEGTPVTTSTDSLTATASSAANAPTESKGSELDPGSVIIGHVTDAHSWHLCDIEKNGEEHAVAISLPIILINDGHLDVFMSKRFEHGHADYKGYRLVCGGLTEEGGVFVDEAGQLIQNADGSVKKPIGKTNAIMMLSND